MSATPKQVPDPATTYERAKPKQQSPSGRLDAPKTNPPRKQDHLQKANEEPSEPKKQ